MYWNKRWLFLALAVPALSAFGMDDPFRPPDTSITATPSSLVSEPSPLPRPHMIVTQGTQRLAWIGNTVLQPGEEFRGFRLLSIEPNRLLWLRPDGETQQAPLLPSVLFPHPPSHKE